MKKRRLQFEKQSEHPSDKNSSRIKTYKRHHPKEEQTDASDAEQNQPIQHYSAYENTSRNTTSDQSDTGKDERISEIRQPTPSKVSRRRKQPIAKNHFPDRNTSISTDIATRSDHTSDNTSDSADADNRHIKKLKHKHNKLNAKLERTTEKIPHKKKLARERIYKEIADGKGGVSYNRLRFSETQIPQSEAKWNKKAGVVRETEHAAIGYIAGKAHQKISEVERENAGVQSAHFAEKQAEAVFRQTEKTYRHIKNRPYRATRKFAEKRVETEKRLAEAKLKIEKKEAPKGAKSNPKKKPIKRQPNRKRRLTKKQYTNKHSPYRRIKLENPLKLTGRFFVRKAKLIGVLVTVALLLIIVSIAILMTNSLMTTIMSGAGATLGGIFSSPTENGENSDYDIREFILNTENGIPQLRANFAGEVFNQTGGNHHVTRVFIGNIALVNPSYAEIYYALPTAEELATQMQAVFYGLLLLDYDLLIDENEAYLLFADMFSNVLSFNTIATTEWCGQSLTTGIGTINTHTQCGTVHSLGDCPNMRSGVHEEYTCSNCCEHENDDDTNNDGAEICSGYSHCNSHSVLTVEVSYHGFDDLFYTYLGTRLVEALQEGDESQIALIQSLLELIELMHQLVIGEHGDSITFGMSSGSVSGTAVYGTWDDMMVSPFYHMWQWEGYWANRRYGPPGASTFARAGCFPVTYAMIIWSLTGNYVSPVEIGNYITSIGQRGTSGGTMHGATQPVMNRYGLSATQVGTNASAITNALSSGQLVFLSVGNSPTNTFTNGGHAIVMRGITPDGRIVLGCSARRTVNNHAFDLNFVLQHARPHNIWVVGN